MTIAEDFVVAVVSCFQVHMRRWPGKRQETLGHSSGLEMGVYQMKPDKFIWSLKISRNKCRWLYCSWQKLQYFIIQFSFMHPLKQPHCYFNCDLKTHAFAPSTLHIKTIERNSRTWTDFLRSYTRKVTH